MNKIIEMINYASDSYWGDPARFKFNARIDSFNTVIEVADGKDRSVKSTFDIKLNGYIIPDTFQKDVTAIKKFTEKSKIVFGIETTDNMDIIEGTVEGDRIVNLTPSNQEAQKRTTLVP